MLVPCTLCRYYIIPYVPNKYMLICNHESRFNFLCWLNNNAQRINIKPVVGLERMTTGTIVKHLTLSRHTGRPVFQFFWADDLLTFKNKQKHTKKQENNNTVKSTITDEHTWCQTIVNIPLVLIKQFNLFPVARGIVAIIHSQYIIYTHR